MVPVPVVSSRRVPSRGRWTALLAVGLLLASSLGILTGGFDSGATVADRGTPTAVISASLAAGQYYLNFSSTGFSGNPSWTVTLNGSLVSSNNGNSVVSFSLYPAIYTYSITGGGSYSPNPSSGTVDLTGNTTVPIVWSQVLYTLTFSQSTLPAGNMWSVSVNGLSIGTTTGPSLSTTLPNGTVYSFTVTSLNSSYSPSPASGGGTLTSNFGYTITFSLVASDVTFSETGLPGGMTWTVTIPGIGSQTSSATSMTFKSVPIGTYSFSVSASNSSWSAAGGSFTVGNQPVTVAVAFSEVTFTVEFFRQAAGLPAGTSWSVSFDGGIQSSTTQIINFKGIPNGTYTFTVLPIAGYTATPNSGWDNVTGSTPNPVVIVWSSVLYNVTVNETGLGSSPAKWWINLTSPIASPHPGIGSPIVLNLPNNTYSFTIACQDKRWEPVQASGTFTVNGLPITVSIQFVELNTSVTFTASGLPAGMPWWVNLTGRLSANSTTASIVYQLPNGTYNFSAQAANRTYGAQGGSFTVVYGVPLYLSVNFTHFLYALTFNESGLFAGTNWSIVVFGAAQYTTGPAITFMEPNGTYPYVVPPVPGFVTKNPNGSVRVHGTTAYFTINFKPFAYGIRFNETGLPRGTGWSVNVSFASNLTHVGTFSFTSASGGVPLANGTYLYSAASSNLSWTPEVPTGQVTVAGAPFNVSVVFILKAYSVTFSATGLPSGAQWSVQLNGAIGTSTTANLTFFVNNGTYAYVIPLYGVYAPRPTSGNVTVQGQSAVVPVVFVRALFTVTFRELGIPSGYTWSVTLNGVTQHTTGSTIVFNETIGTFPFAVPSAAGLASNPSSGSVHVSNANQTVTISFGSVSQSSGLSQPETFLVVALFVAGMLVVVAYILSRRPPRSQASPVPPTPPSGAVNPVVAPDATPTPAPTPEPGDTSPPSPSVPSP